jgi:hypothetical protein
MFISSAAKQLPRSLHFFAAIFGWWIVVASVAIALIGLYFYFKGDQDGIEEILNGEISEVIDRIFDK